MGEFYSPYGWQGSKYQEVRKQGLSTTDIAKLIRNDIKKKFPKVKASVRTQYFAGGSAIDVYIKDAPFNPINPKWNPKDWSATLIQNPRYTKQGSKLLKDIEKLGQKYQLHDVDSMTDYFNVSFYLDVKYDYDSEREWIRKMLIK